MNPKPCKQDEEAVQHVDLYSSSLLLDGFDLDDSSNDSDEDDFKLDYGSLDLGPTDNPNDEKIIAQRQLLKAAKMQKHKSSKKKLLAKNGGKAGEFSIVFQSKQVIIAAAGQLAVANILC